MRGEEELEAVVEADVAVEGFKVDGFVVVVATVQVTSI